MPIIFSLHEIYELRNVTRISSRISVGRLFLHNGRFGIKDISGALWPISFETVEESLNAGDVIQFYSHFVDYVLHIKKILDISKQIAPWKNSFIPEPLVLVLNRNQKNPKRTYYFKYPKSRKRFHLLERRNSALERTKQFFSNRGFFYAETPILVPSGGMETYLHTFQTQYLDYKGREWTFELPTSPEFALKKLIAEGIPKIFQISRAFRNHGELSPLHEPEFMMLEWYRVGGTLKDIMFDTQKLVLALAKYLNSKKRIPEKWKTFEVRDLFLTLLKLNLEELQQTALFYEKSRHLSISLRDTDTWDDIFCKLFMEKIEPFLKKQIACFVTGYPAQMSALATHQKNNQIFVQRTEAYLFGIEICNGYQELVDASEFEKRLQKMLNDRAGNIRRDEYFENVMRFGLPPCAGNAVGIDRVIALLLGVKNMSDLFPLSFKNLIQ